MPFHHRQVAAAVCITAAWIVGAAPAQASSALANKYGCLGCHASTSQLVGPAYQAVAAKYGSAGGTTSGIDKALCRCWRKASARVAAANGARWPCRPRPSCLKPMPSAWRRGFWAAPSSFTDRRRTLVTLGCAVRPAEHLSVDSVVQHSLGLSLVGLSLVSSWLVPATPGRVQHSSAEGPMLRPSPQQAGDKPCV